MAERCAQTMKASLIKTMEEGEDMDLALLTYKTAPLSHRLPSPAELLHYRKYKTLLPDPQGLSGSQIDSLSLNKTVINSRDSLETFIYL